MLSDEGPANALRRDLLQVALAVTAAAAAPAALGAASRAAPGKFSVSEHETLLAIGATLLPGADLARFVSGMLSREIPLLSYPFISFPLDVRAFYHDVLAALDSAYAKSAHGTKEFVHLSGAGGRTAPHARARRAGQLKGWDGPPPGLVYFVLRSDATDAVYGHPHAYEQLQIPYMAHIQPPPFE